MNLGKTMNVKKITNEVKIDKVLSKKVLSKIATTSNDDWKNYYKNLNPSINSLVHNLTKKNIHCKSYKNSFFYRIHQ